MNLIERMHEVDRLVANGHHPQAVIAAGSLLEALLSALYNDAFPRLPPDAQQEVVEKVEAIGQGKAVSDFTLGQLVGLFREARLFDKAQTGLGRDLPHLRSANFSLFVNLRNRATHEGAEVHEDEAHLYASQLRVFLREAGYLEPPPRPSSHPPRLRPWTQVVHLHTDVEAGERSTATYAIDLGAVVAGDPNMPAVYRDARAFFRASYLTSGLRRLLHEVLSRLAGTGPEGDRVLQLRSPFGGGKSHVLLALYHAVCDHAALASLPEALALPDPGLVRVAWFDGEKFDAVTGKAVDGLRPELAEGGRVHTRWGWLGWQLAQSAGDSALFERVREHDERRVTPAGDVKVRLKPPCPRHWGGPAETNCSNEAFIGGYDADHSHPSRPDRLECRRRRRAFLRAHRSVPGRNRAGPGAAPRRTAEKRTHRGPSTAAPCSAPGRPSRRWPRRWGCGCNPTAACSTSTMATDRAAPTPQSAPPTRTATACGAPLPVRSVSPAARGWATCEPASWPCWRN